MLHTVNKSPFSHSSLESCLRFAGEGDVILLLEDGVFAAARDTGRSRLIEETLKTIPVYAIEADVQARGLDTLIEGVKLASYADFVKLLETHKSQAWL